MYALKRFDRVLAFYASESEASAVAEKYNSSPAACTNEFTVIPYSDVELANFFLTGIDQAHSRLDSHNM